MNIFEYVLMNWEVILKIILTDVVLSVDNALIIAMVCAGLKKEHQGVAMKWGMSVAVIARILFLFIAFILIQIPLLKLIAGLWLIKLSYDMVKGDDGSAGDVKQHTTLNSAIFAVIVADIAMSLDNVLAVVGASGEGENVLYSLTLFGHLFDITDSYPLAIAGILISIPILLFASKNLMKYIEKYPVLNTVGGLLIAFVGLELALKDNLFKDAITKTALELSISTNSLIASVSAVLLAILYFAFKKLGKNK